MKFTEEKLEQAFIELLGAEKIPYLPGQEIARATDEVLIKEDLKTFLHQQYQAEEITSSEIDAIVLKLERLPSSDLYESNKFFMKMVSDGFLFKREDPTKKTFISSLLITLTCLPKERRQEKMITFIKLSTSWRSRDMKKGYRMVFYISMAYRWWCLSLKVPFAKMPPSMMHSFSLRFVIKEIFRSCLNTMRFA